MHGAALRYFVEVVQTGSIAEASARLNVAGSAISRQIAKLEADLGVDLFERRPRGMVPSAAGELLANHARRTFLDAEALLGDLKRLRGLEAGVVRVASTEGFGMLLMPLAMARFHQQHPGIRFELKVGGPDYVTRLVKEGEVDIGATFSFAPEPSVEVIASGSARLVAIVPKEHPYAVRAELTLAELARANMALPEKIHTARQMFDLACGLEDIVVDPVLVSSSIASLWGFLEAGMGITVASAFTASARMLRGRVVAIPIRSSALDQRQYQIQTMLGRHLPDAAEAFTKELLIAMSEL